VLEEPVLVQGLPLAVEASIGVSFFPSGGEDASSLLQHADVAMYAAKQAGSEYAFYDEVTDTYDPARLTLVSELRGAMDRRELVLHYQPEAMFGSGKVSSVEALLRWNHPERGSVSPDDFIPLAQETGLICGGQMSVYIEPIEPSPELYVIGAGHVGFSLANLAHEVGFRVHVVDDREKFANRERFPNAAEIAEWIRDAHGDLTCVFHDQRAVPLEHRYWLPDLDAEKDPFKVSTVLTPDGHLTDDQSLKLLLDRVTVLQKEIYEVIGELAERGVAYEAPDGVYFDVSRVDGYGLLAQQRLDSLRAGARVDANEGRRKNSDRRQHAEAPADVRGDVERADSFGSSDGPERASFRVGDEDEMAACVIAERVLEATSVHEILRHRLGSAAGLRRDAVQRTPRGNEPDARRIRCRDIFEFRALEVLHCHILPVGCDIRELFGDRIALLREPAIS